MHLLHELQIGRNPRRRIQAKLDQSNPSTNYVVKGWIIAARAVNTYCLVMRAVEVVFAVGWGAFWIAWLAAAFSMRRGRVPWSRELGIRAVIAVVVILLIRLGAFRGHGLETDLWRRGIGLLLFAVGLGFAVWARVHIGRSWGPPMTQRDHPEIVTSGPYALVRHPIYSGILAAGVGTAVALDGRWLTVVVLAGVYFTYSATVEERYLTEQLPDSYPAYRASTKMLIPFVF